MEPAIKNWRNFPPIGGWALDYFEDGQKFNFSGQPKKILQQIRKVQEANGTFQSEDAIWLYMNRIWCSRDPAKCIHSMLTLRAAAPVRSRGTSGPVSRGTGGCGKRGGGCGGGTVR